MTLAHPKARGGHGDDLFVPPLFSLETQTIPRHEVARGELPPSVAYQLIHDKLPLKVRKKLGTA